MEKTSIKSQTASSHISTEDDKTKLHVTPGQLPEFGREIADFITRRIREMNGVDETDPRLLCFGCVGAATFNTFVEIADDELRAVYEGARTIPLNDRFERVADIASAAVIIAQDFAKSIPDLKKDATNAVAGNLTDAERADELARSLPKLLDRIFREEGKRA